jgi:hypothetical protein
MDVEEAREMYKMANPLGTTLTMEDSNTIWCVLNKLNCSEATIKFLRGELTKVCDTLPAVAKGVVLEDELPVSMPQLLGP